MGEGKPTEEVLNIEWLADRELHSLRHEFELEVKGLEQSLEKSEISLDVEFHDREDFKKSKFCLLNLVYKRIAGELRSRLFCSELLNVPPRGGEFLRE